MDYKRIDGISCRMCNYLRIYDWNYVIDEDAP